VAEDQARPVVPWAIDAKDQDTIQSFAREMVNWKIADGPIAAVDAESGGPPPEGLTGHILPGDTARVVIDSQVLDLLTERLRTSLPIQHDLTRVRARSHG
jgi:hypothetical protein